MSEATRKQRIEATVRSFGVAMARKLHENDHKPDWREEDVDTLFDRLMGEAKELSDEFVAGAMGDDTKANWHPVKVARECVDIANFAMMIADISGGLDQTEAVREAVTIEALQREVLRLTAESEHFEAKWRDVAERYGAERQLRQDAEAKLAAQD